MNRAFRLARPTPPAGKSSVSPSGRNLRKNPAFSVTKPAASGTDFHGTHSGFSKLPPLHTLTRSRVRPPPFVGHDPMRRGGDNEGWPIARGIRPKPTP